MSTFLSQSSLSIAQKICELEAQTFLTDESRLELAKQYELFQSTVDFSKWNLKQWRILMALECTYAEWCRDVDFENLSVEQQKTIFSENPCNWYAQFLT